MIQKKILPVVVSVLGAGMLVSCSPKSATVGNGDDIIDGRDFLPGVSIVYSANVDGEIEPCGCRSNPTGGINRRYNFVDQKVPGEKLIIDSGDLFFQSAPVPPFLEKQWLYQARVLLKGYNALGVEAMVPGELDFADGLDPLLKLLSEAKFKVLAANIYRKGQSKPLFEPYVILKKGGKRVALFGIYDETLPLPEGVEARDHVAAAKEMAALLRGQADVVLALTHEGLDKDIALAKELTGVDAIFGAHTQSFLIRPEKVGDMLIFQPSFRGQHIGVYAGGGNKMYQIDERFDSKPPQFNPLDKVVADAKTEIARINKDSEAELMNTGGKAHAKFSPHARAPGYLTFAQCAQCHKEQYEFHKNTPHMRAFATLVAKHQSANLDCLKCHTVGEGQAEGWKSVNRLVLNNTGKPIDADNFAKSLPNMDIEALSKISRAYINVQCENCHGMGAEHPMGRSKFVDAVTADTCLRCHTADRAPGWWKNGKPDPEVIQAKFKSMTCPAMRK